MPHNDRHFISCNRNTTREMIIFVPGKYIIRYRYMCQMIEKCHRFPFAFHSDEEDLNASPCVQNDHNEIFLKRVKFEIRIVQVVK